MYLYTIISSLICLQLLSTVSSDAVPADPEYQSRTVAQQPNLFDSAANINEDSPKQKFMNFARFSQLAANNRPYSSIPASYIRLVRGGQVGGAFLRFGRQNQNRLSSNSLLSGTKGEFLRFG